MQLRMCVCTPTPAVGREGRREGDGGRDREGGRKRDGWMDGWREEGRERVRGGKEWGKEGGIPEKGARVRASELVRKYCMHAMSKPERE